TLAGHASCTVTVKFQPMAAGTTTSNLVLSATTGGSVLVMLTGQGGYALTVAKATVAGTVTDNLGQLTCDPTCASATAAYAAGSAVTLTAVTSPAYFFTGWSAPCDTLGPRRQCGITVPVGGIGVTALYKPLTNLMFITSATYSPTSAQGIAFFDNECNNRAA